MSGRVAITTYKAMDKSNNRPVMITELQKNERSAAFLKEMEWHKDCNSNCILQYYGCCEHNDNYWVVNLSVIKVVAYNGGL